MTVDLSKVLGLQIVEKAYDDLVHPVAAEVGKLFAKPLKVLNLYGDRVLTMLTEATKAVPPERQIPAAPSIAGPILENVKYLEEGNPLLSMYQKLLTQLIDKDGVANAHPAFPGLVQQLSPDEAWFLFSISKASVRRETVITIEHLPNGERNSKTVQVYPDEFISRFWYSHLVETYVNRLMLLGLLEMHHQLNGSGVSLTGSPPVEKSVTVYDFKLSAFGKLFAKAAIPDEWEHRPIPADDGTG